MKKFYVFLTLMLALCGFGTAQAADYVVKELGTAVTAASEITEGTVILLENVNQGVQVFEKENVVPAYGDNPGYTYWSVRAGSLKLSDVNSLIYTWKLTDVKVSGESVTCLLQGGVSGTYMRPLEDGRNVENVEKDNAETFTLSKTDAGNWLITGSNGVNLNVYVDPQYGDKLIKGSSDGENQEFKIYKPVIAEGEQTYKIEFQVLDEGGNIVSQYSSSVDAVMGELVTIPNLRLWNYSFDYISTDDGETDLKLGDQVQVTGDAVYYINIVSWPTIYFALFDEAGDSIYDSKTDEVVVSDRQCEPNRPLQLSVGADGYYVSGEVSDSLSKLIVGVDVNNGDTVNVTMSRKTHVTFKFVDASDETKVLAEDYIYPCEPGDFISHVPGVDWYTLVAADSMYIAYMDEDYNWIIEWTVGTADTTIVLHYNADPLPFEATTVADGAFAADTKWYGMLFNGGYLTYNDGKLVLTADAAELTDNMLWAFTGDLANGYCIYNKSVGAAQALYVDMATIDNFVAPVMAANGTPFALGKGWNGVVSMYVSVEQEGSIIPLALNNFEGKGEIVFYSGEYIEQCLSDENSHIDFIDSDDTSSIDSVVAEGAGKGAIYDLSGRVVVNPAKGIYIQNGKKVILK